MTAWYRTALEIEIRIKDARSGEISVEKVKHFETIQNSLTSRFPVLLSVTSLGDNFLPNQTWRKLDLRGNDLILADGFTSVASWANTNTQRDVAKVVIKETLRLNPHGRAANPRPAPLRWDADMIESFSLYKLGITELPEVFGGLSIKGDLNLAYNKLASLPASFGSLNVGGSLKLYHNELVSLPPKFGKIQIGTNLSLQDNKLTSLPVSIGEIKLKGTLDLSYNCLQTVPASFGTLEVGKAINLAHNEFPTGSIPSSYKSRRRPANSGLVWY